MHCLYYKVNLQVLVEAQYRISFSCTWSSRCASWKGWKLWLYWSLSLSPPPPPSPREYTGFRPWPINTTKSDTGQGIVAMDSTDYMRGQGREGWDRFHQNAGYLCCLKLSWASLSGLTRKTFTVEPLHLNSPYYENLCAISGLTSKASQFQRSQCV